DVVVVIGLSAASPHVPCATLFRSGGVTCLFSGRSADLFKDFRARQAARIELLGGRLGRCSESGRIGLHDFRIDRVELHAVLLAIDRKSTRLKSSHVKISYAVFCVK